MHSTRSTHAKQLGVSLVELMVGLAIIGIILSVGVPSAQSIIIQNRIVSEINEVSGVIQFARNNAIDEQLDTIVCPTQDFSNCTTNWSQAKMVFGDEDGDGARGVNEELLVATSIISSANYMEGPATTIRFQGNGAVTTMATLLLCHKDKEAKYARALTVSLQGRVKISRDDDKNNIHEDNSGQNLSCS